MNIKEIARQNKRKISSGEKMKSVWKANSVLPQFPRLKGKINTDVLIIGGGLAGILTALFLKEKGVDYVLVEKNRICSGITGNTTAKITYQHGLIYSKLLERDGIVRAQGYLKANQRAAEKYAELCHSIDCDYTQKDNYVYSLKSKAKLLKEMEEEDNAD